MSEDNKTNSEKIEIGADLETPTVSEEKLKKAMLVDELNDEVSVKKELPKRSKPTAQIPNTAELGKKFTVKLDKRYDIVNLKIYQGEKIKEDAGNSNIVHDKDEKNTDEISYDFFDPFPLKGKTLNSLTKGKYLVQIHAYGQEAGDELTQEQIIEVQ